MPLSGVVNGSTPMSVPSPTTQLPSSAPSLDLERYARQTILPTIGAEGQGKLLNSRVLVVGCGALGSASANLLARAGIGHLTIVDRDYVELSNLQRQVLFDETDVRDRIPKAAAAAEKLQRINNDVVIEGIITDLNAGNVERLASGADVIVDGLDNFETRYLLNDVAVKHGIPWVYGGVIASYGMTMTIRPGSSPCLRCVFPEPPPAGSAPTCDTAGVIGPAVETVAAIQAAEVMKLVVGDIGALNTSLLAVDLWHISLDRVPLPALNPSCPTCGRRDFTFLDNATPSQTTSLCGHDAVQVLPQGAQKLDLGELRRRLDPVGDTTANRFLLRFRPTGSAHELTVFPDGRAIVKGTTDSTQARSLYARYIGA